MKPRALVLALMATGTLAPGVVRAQLDNLKPEENCAVMVVYAATQLCSRLSNGLTQCQPVGMVGPSPNCPNAKLQPLMPVPLSPPVIQPPGAAGRPYGAAAAGPYALPYAWPFGQTPYAIPYPGYAPRPVAIPSPVAMPKAAAPVTAPVAKVEPAAPAAAIKPETPAAPPQPAVATAPVPPAAPAPAPQPVAAAPAQPAPSQPTQPVVAPAPAPQSAVSPAPTAEAAPTPTAEAAPTPAAAPAEPPSAREIEDALAHFEFDSATLTDKGRALLDAWLAQYPRDTPVRVTGHADRLGPEPYNLKLSQRRAETVRQYLLDKGVAAKYIEIIAKGETEPVKACKGGATPLTKACLAPNRRVVIDPE